MSSCIRPCPAVSAYVVRRLPEAIDPGDVVAEVFTVVWRRRDQLVQRRVLVESAEEAAQTLPC